MPNIVVGLSAYLIIAIKKGSTDMVMALVEGGADVNVRWKKKKALHYAKEKGDSEVIRILENNGAFLN